MRLKADVSQLNLPHGTKLKSGKQKKTNKSKTDMLRSIGKQSGKYVEPARKKKRKATVGKTCRKGRFKPGMKE